MGRWVVVTCLLANYATRQLVNFPVMQRKQAIKLQETWAKQPCDHPAFAKEYDLGKRTGSYVCTQCGAILTFRERAEAIAARDKLR